MALTDLQKKLLSQKTIDIWGTISKETSGYVRECLQILTTEGSPTVLITLSSGGGSGDAGLDIYDMIKFYPGKSIGIVFPAAGSAACTILQACNWRVATPNSHILIHHISFDIRWDVLIDEKKREEFIASKGHFKTTLEILAQRTNKHHDEIFKKCDDDRWISAREALEFALLDEIVETAAEIKFPENVKKEGPA
jgi:ATP-dependent Clp protease protease subunit